jgi:hypothetical protein
MRYFKHVNQTLTSGNGNPSRKSFKVLETTITNGFAKDNGKSVDFYDNFMCYVCTKLHSGKYFYGIDGVEINERSFKIQDTKASQRLQKYNQKIATKRLKVSSKNAVQKLKKSFELEIITKQATEKAILMKKEIAKFNIENSVDKQDWHDKANRIVMLIGTNFVPTLGWKTVLNIALNR